MDFRISGSGVFIRYGDRLSLRGEKAEGNPEAFGESRPRPAEPVGKTQNNVVEGSVRSVARLFVLNGKRVLQVEIGGQCVTLELGPDMRLGGEEEAQLVVPAATQAEGDADSSNTASETAASPSDGLGVNSAS